MGRARSFSSLPASITSDITSRQSSPPDAWPAARVCVCVLRATDRKSAEGGSPARAFCRCSSLSPSFLQPQPRRFDDRCGGGELLSSADRGSFSSRAWCGCSRAAMACLRYSVQQQRGFIRFLRSFRGAVNVSMDNRYRGQAWNGDLSRVTLTALYLNSSSRWAEGSRALELRKLTISDVVRSVEVVFSAPYRRFIYCKTLKAAKWFFVVLEMKISIWCNLGSEVICV